MHEAIQKQPSRGVLRKRCSENSRKFTGEHPLNLLDIFRTPILKNTSGRLLLAMGR